MAKITWREKIRHFFTINRSLLPFKAHYFLYCSGAAGVVPIYSLYGKDLGISATAFGLINSINPFFKMVTKPIFGALADYFKQLKLILLTLILLTTFPRLGLMLIPSRYHVSPLSPTGVYCSLNNTRTSIFGEYNATCLHQTLNSEAVVCNSKCGDCRAVNSSEILQWNMSQCSYLCQSEENATEEGFTGDLILPDNHIVRANIYSVSDGVETFLCRCNQPVTCLTTCQEETAKCFIPVQKIIEDGSLYTSATFWLFFVLLLVTDVAEGGVTSLGDAGCYERLRNEPELYGRQRLWGTVGWGATALLVGYLNDLVTGDASKVNYTTGFYLMAALMFLDFLVIFKADLHVDQYSENIFKDVGSLLHKREVVTFLISVICVGAFTSFLPAYLFWYLQGMGASQMLLGLTLTVECFLAELPCLFFANYIVGKIGCISALTLTFLAYTVRYIGYCYINNPWWALPLELTHGITFGVFYSAITLYSKNIAPPGTEATMQSLTGAAYDGLGKAAGSLLAGIGFDKLGGRRTFFIAGIVSVNCAILNTCLYYIPKHRKKPSRTNNSSESLSGI